MESGGAGDDCLAFEVNGRKFELPEIDPSTTLLDFLRSSTPFKSVKLGCGEGISLSVEFVILDTRALSKSNLSFMANSCDCNSMWETEISLFYG